MRGLLEEAGEPEERSMQKPRGKQGNRRSNNIINPPAQGTEAVLDRYAQLVMDSIEKDAFFIRVPAAKLFYVYVTEGILTAKATVGGSHRSQTTSTPQSHASLANWT
jgi:hypothetical protein